MTAGLAVVLLIGIVIAFGFALDDPAVLDAIEREGAAVRRAVDWVAARPIVERLTEAMRPATDWVAEAVYIGAAGLTETYARVRYAYRRREGRHYAGGVHHFRPATQARVNAGAAGRHRAYATGATA